MVRLTVSMTWIKQGTADYRMSNRRILKGVTFGMTNDDCRLTNCGCGFAQSFYEIDRIPSFDIRYSTFAFTNSKKPKFIFFIRPGVLLAGNWAHTCLLTSIFCPLTSDLWLLFSDLCLLTSDLCPLTSDTCSLTSVFFQRRTLILWTVTNLQTVLDQNFFTMIALDLLTFFSYLQ